MNRPAPAAAAILLATALVVAGCSGDEAAPEATTTTAAQPSGTIGPAQTPTTTSTTTPAGQPTTTGAPAAGQEVYYTPVTVDQGATQVTFDRWFWALLDGTGTVTVTTDGEMVAEGPISGDGAVMSQEPDGTLVFVDASGNEVARVTQQELFETIQQAVEDAGIG